MAERAQLIGARASVAGSTRPAAGACDVVAETGADQARSAGLGNAFAQRQHFKILADCLIGGSAAVHPADAARVLNTAVKDSIPLLGVGDLIRIQRSQAVVNQTLRIREGGSVWRPGSPTLKLQLPSQVRPTSVLT